LRRRTFYASDKATLLEAVRTAVSTEAGDCTQLIARGAVYVNGKREQRTEVQVAAGALISVVLTTSGSPLSAPSGPGFDLAVLYEDADILVLDKPSGVLAQPGPGRVGDSLLDVASAHLKFRAGLVHRLDRETSGVTVFGKTLESTRSLAQQFRSQLVRKQYIAAVDGALTGAGVISMKLRPDPTRAGRYLAETHGNGVPAETAYQVLKTDTVSVVVLFPKTGRTHQLRAHLTALKHPIVGDTRYGGSTAASRCLLHAWRLTVSGKTFTAPIPKDLMQFCQGIDFDSISSDK
jgi:23S rRNA pseudouridine1911/1915/1917 synthase